jgi:hypothetical protein
LIGVIIESLFLFIGNGFIHAAYGLVFKALFWTNITACTLHRILTAIVISRFIFRLYLGVFLAIGTIITPTSSPRWEKSYPYIIKRVPTIALSLASQSSIW